jgi:hypothetical protein
VPAQESQALKGEDGSAPCSFPLADNSPTKPTTQALHLSSVKLKEPSEYADSHPITSNRLRVYRDSIQVPRWTSDFDQNEYKEYGSSRFHVDLSLNIQSTTIQSHSSERVFKQMERMGSIKEFRVVGRNSSLGRFTPARVKAGISTIDSPVPKHPEAIIDISVIEETQRSRISSAASSRSNQSARSK